MPEKEASSLDGWFRILPIDVYPEGQDKIASGELHLSGAHEIEPKLSIACFPSHGCRVPSFMDKQAFACCAYVSFKQLWEKNKVLPCHVTQS